MTDFKDIGFAPRYVARIQSQGVRGELFKRLAELIKNADDAYDRLELKGEKTSGEIEVIYENQKSGKAWTAKAFYVRDFGSGMSRDNVESAYGGNTSYGSDTSGETRNGAIGVGGKDAFYAMETCFIITTQNQVLTIVQFQTSKNRVLQSRILDDEKEKQTILDFYNDRLVKGNLEKISLDKNQTIAIFNLPQNEPGVYPGNLADNLTQYTTLRWILESEIRKVNLIDISTGNARHLKHSPIAGELLFENSYEIYFNSKPYKIEIQLLKSFDELKNGHNSNIGYGIQIQDARGAILDNQMYGLESDPGSSKIFGKVIFHNWKQLYRDSNGEILTNNREGLDYKHSVNAQLKQIILTNLKPILDKEKQSQSTNSKFSGDVDKNIRKAFDIVNKLLLEKNNIFTGGLNGPTIPDSLVFESKKITIVEKQIKNIKLYINSSKIETNSDISLSLTGDGILIEPESIVKTPISYDPNNNRMIDEGVPYVEIKVTANPLNGNAKSESTIKAFYGTYQAEIQIEVIAEPLIKIQNGFQFIPGKTTITPKNKYRIQLLIDTNLVAVGTPISLACNNDRIEFTPQKLTVSGPPNIGQYITSEILVISGKTIGTHAKLEATVEIEIRHNHGVITKEIRKTECEILVKEKEPPKTFFTDYVLRSNLNSHVRSSFSPSDGIINIHTNFPVLNYVFGNDPKQKIEVEKSDDALVMLAHTIIEALTYNTAKKMYESGQLIPIGDLAEAIQTKKQELDYEIGLPLHQIIISGKLSHQ